MDKNPSAPTCVGIILDGNRRWAKECGLPKLEGHRRGYERALDAARWVRDRGVKHLAIYVFSTENWNREKEEVSYLMSLLREAAQKGFNDLANENVRIRFIGTRDQLAPDLLSAMEEVEERSKNNAFTLWVCLSYGGRAEIVAAVNALADKKGATEESLRARMWSAEMPDPDIIIRPGGEKRLSNFLTWQSIYSELFFIDPHWPDFSEKLLDEILTEFARRERRRGK